MTYEAWRISYQSSEQAARAAYEECAQLRTRIEEMERQEPVAQVGVHKTGGNAGIAWSARPLNEFDSLPLLREGDRLYLAPGAQPAPSLASGDASLISVGKTQPTQSVKNVIIDDLQSQFDTEGITEHDSGDALIRLSDAIAAVEDNFAQPAPSIPEGWKLVPIEPTYEMLEAGEDTFVPTYTGTPVSAPIDVYRAMLAAAPEAK